MLTPLPGLGNWSWTTYSILLGLRPQEVGPCVVSDEVSGDIQQGEENHRDHRRVNHPGDANQQRVSLRWLPSLAATYPEPTACSRIPSANNPGSAAPASMLKSRIFRLAW